MLFHAFTSLHFLLSTFIFSFISHIMHLTGKSNQPKREVLRVILDEPRLYIEESLGSVLVRGEVIVNFEKDTHIQGPIELLFEGIQRFITWPGIINS
jgi:hypothetical protein